MLERISGRRPRRTLALAGLGMALAASLVAGPLAPVASAADEPLLNVPSVGDCHDLTGTEAVAESDDKAPVDCARSHTSQTVAVIRFATTPDWDDLAGVFGTISTTCYRAWARTLDGSPRTRAMSAYDLVWFAPTQAERDAGARWARCDLVLFGGRNRLVRLPAPKDVSLGARLARAETRCMTEGKTRYYTVCSRKHGWRATGAEPMRSTSHPSPKAALKFAKRVCGRHLISRYFLYSYPSDLEWKAGARMLVCYSKTTT